MKNALLQKLLSLDIKLKNVNGSLKVDAPKGALTKDLIDEINANKIYLLKLLGTNLQIPKAEPAEDYALSPTQYSLWFIHQHLGGDKAYNLAATLKIEGALNIQLLQDAFSDVIAKHESLRTQFVKKENGITRQRILANEEVDFILKYEDFSDKSTEALHQRLHEENQTAFELDKDLLVSASIFKKASNEHVLLFVMHHIISDGWSLQVFTQEVMSIYFNKLNGTISNQVDLPLQYKDYSEWLNKQIDTEEYKEKLNFWENQFKTFSPPLALASSTRPIEKTYNGTLIHHDFSPRFTEEVNAFAKSNQMTLFMVLLGGLNGVFSKYSNQYDITFGTTVAGREHPDLQDQIGLYSNALAIRTQFEKENTFSEFLQIQKQVLLKAYENKEYPFTKLLNNLKVPNDSSRSPLFDVMVLLQNHQTLHLDDQDAIKDLKLSEYDEVEKDISQLDMSFVFIERKDQLTLSVEYNTDIYDHEFVKGMIHHFETFLTIGMTHQEREIQEISLINTDEAQQIRFKFNSLGEAQETTKTVVDLISEMAIQYPENEALISFEDSISYSELEIYSNQVANYLQKGHQVSSGDFVGIALDGNPWTIITILSVLKIGAAYVPIDPQYPEARKDIIETKSNCKIVINDELLREIKNNRSDYSDDFNRTAELEDLAYVIFTSGTTGIPKGIPITHNSLIDYSLTFANYFDLQIEDKILQQASISFDTSIEEIFPILISGGTLVFQKEKSDFDAMFKMCEEYKVTVLSTNPYALQYLNQTYQNYDLNLRTLISGGDTLRMDYINNICTFIPTYNTYGPTESTVCSTYYKVEGNESIIPIGKPIRNRQVYILSLTAEYLVPVGAIGELCISGAGLTKGYLGNDELTREKFIPHPFMEGEYLYKTGDLAKWLPDGNILFLGRKDTQVSLRGFRIELEGIENVAQKIEGVTQAVASVKTVNQESVIVLYWTKDNNEFNKSHLRAEMVKLLPSYMLPSYYVLLNELPLNRHGKIDRTALPEFALEDGLIQEEYIAPRSEIEEKLVYIWQSVLNVDKIGITNNFFELGGHSLLAIVLVNEINKEFEPVSLQIKNLFMSNTIESMAQLISVLDTTDMEDAYDEFVI